MELPITVSVKEYSIVNTLGQTVQAGMFDVTKKHILTSQLNSGWYVLLLHADKETYRMTFVVE